ncbi:ZIP zinc transporter domain-containing protein [Ditylenchus destructor]|uniref:ZIP zinc transporter domain-containing protein n=1 Tax=Ditylenchus destructor TaxID=166010 RepID=A0AAD4R501_9BILA|nr:ZIP zinc transporter domain-containing protein [Ditylenchus destructor]
MGLEPFDWKPSTSNAASDGAGPPTNLDALCASWMTNNSIPQNILDQQLNVQFSTQRPSHFLVWTLGLSFVTIISLCALVGIILMRFLEKKLFNKFITFFVSVGVGSLSGSAVFHLLPQAFGLVAEFESNANHDYLGKAFAAVIGIYLFFFSDKAIKILLETKKRNKHEASELSQMNHHNVYVREDKENGIADRMHSGHSSDALISGQNEAAKSLNKQYHKMCKVQKPNNEIAQEETDESFNRQAHSLCVHDHDMQYKEGDSVIATVAWMIIFGDGLHNLIDGISIGASFSESILSGVSVSVAVLCEEFPHELGDVAILVSAGMTLRQALVYNLLSALTCYLGFIIGVVVGNVDDSFASYTFGFAGGMFLYISMACMMPEMKMAMEEALKVSLSKGLEVLCLQAIGVACGLATMACMARYGSDISFS